MVIQSNMSAKAIVEIWKNTSIIFEKFNIPISDKTLESFIDPDTLSNLIVELNNKIGSSSTTCIEGG